MSEYLAPGVYVEEVDTGNKPIEGVSTSTAGVVGVTERGPVDVPVMVTSRGDFERIYGQTLDHDAFTHSGRSHCYLPHAVDGFFTNGGRRMVVTRVAPEGAKHAARTLFDRGTATSASTALLRPAARDSGTALNPPALYVADTNNLPAGDWVRVGDGSRAEYHQVDSAGAKVTLMALAEPLSGHYPAGTAVDAYNLPSPVPNSQEGSLDQAAPAGSLQVDVTLNGGFTPANGNLVSVGEELRLITNVVPDATTPNRYLLSFAVPLQQDHAQDDKDVFVLLSTDLTSTGSGQLGFDGGPGDVLVFAATAAFATTAGTSNVVSFNGGAEYVRVGALGELPLAVPLGDEIQALSAVREVTFDRAVKTDMKPNELELYSVEGLVGGMTVEFDGNDYVIDTVGPNNVIKMLTPHTTTPTSIVRPAKILAADAPAGSAVLSLEDRVDLVAGDIVMVGTAPDEEYAIVAEIVGERTVAPDAGSVVLERPLQRKHDAGAEVRPQFSPLPVPHVEPTYLVLAAHAGATSIMVSFWTHYDQDSIIEIASVSGQRYYERIGAPGALSSTGELVLKTRLRGAQAAGLPVVERQPLLAVQALDVGAWGDRLRVSVEDEARGLVSRARLTDIDQVSNTLRLNSLTGVEPGTILEIQDPQTGKQVDTLLKVRGTDIASNNLVMLDPPGVTAAQVAAFMAAPPVEPLEVRSREFRLTVNLLRQPDPAVPSRNDTVIDRELFQNLSMDPRHSRYVETLIGRIHLAPGEELRRWDRRTHGESKYIRMEDQAATEAEREAIRLGPEALVDVLASGRIQAAKHPLFGGSDSVVTMNDAMYVGSPSIEPENRTGLFSLQNESDISLVAIPGQTTVAVQQAVIDHCENDRYRFAVLDASGPPDDAIVDVEAQRQQFDTKYASLYHPWLLIPNPSPSTVQSIEPLAIPPSGHVLGVIANTDITRGVHKAPANEVVRGIVGLQRSLNKGDQEVLNPSPVNVNVIRDFRPNNRGIRIWGARVITSDSDMRYVNVRRLLIFLEKSIDLHTQWVVFEPNAEPTWARVRRSIANFLTVVWRNGALEGTKADEAFFVKCDRTTMTQTDIDNGRLIAVVGVAPVKPAEFVIIRIGLWTANANS